MNRDASFTDGMAKPHIMELSTTGCFAERWELFIGIGQATMAPMVSPLRSIHYKLITITTYVPL